MGITLPSIRVANLGKVYRFYSAPADSLKEWLFRKPYGESFWALQGVNFELARGASLGVIGSNGAGKSTLLKLLAGTISSTTGVVTRRGQLSAILELGSGFHPDLSGRENIRLSCAAMGLSPRESEQRLPEIIAFSELEGFIDRPVKTYSSGMYARLGFSVATSVNPDILVVDEALAVGDQHFRKKSMDRMLAFRKRGKTLIFCSHILPFVHRLCDQCLWLHKGKPQMLGTTETVIDCYQDYSRSLDARNGVGLRETYGTGAGSSRLLGASRVLDVSLGGDCRGATMETGGTLKVYVRVQLDRAISPADADVRLAIVRNDGVECYSVPASMDGAALEPVGKSEFGVCFVAEELPLLSGRYSIHADLMSSRDTSVRKRWDGAADFKIVHARRKEGGLARLTRRWKHPEGTSASSLN